MNFDSQIMAVGSVALGTAWIVLFVLNAWRLRDRPMKSRSVQALRDSLATLGRDEPIRVAFELALAEKRFHKEFGRTGSAEFRKAVRDEIESGKVTTGDMRAAIYLLDVDDHGRLSTAFTWQYRTLLVVLIALTVPLILYGFILLSTAVLDSDSGIGTAAAFLLVCLTGVLLYKEIRALIQGNRALSLLARENLLA